MKVCTCLVCAYTHMCECAYLLYMVCELACTRVSVCISVYLSCVICLCARCMDCAAMHMYFAQAYV